MEEAQETQISPRHQKHEEEEEEEEDDDDDENPNVEEDLAERDYDSEDQTHQNHPSSQPHMETEVLSDHDIRISQLLVVIKCSLNRLHSSVTAIVPAVPLHLVQILLVAGADPYAQDSQHGWTTLHTAVMTDDVELVKVILVAGVDVNIRNMHNGIPLHIALARGAKSCVELLLSIGANCNVQFAVLPEASLGVDCYLSSLTTITDVQVSVAEDAKAVGASWIIGIDIDSNRFERGYVRQDISASFWLLLLAENFVRLFDKQTFFANS
ncbi:hypothetical protein JHK82_012355 [Glycine max]|nr:hypothetical protein JHK82_012355 [Glycine max]